jgi:putative thioredoxin
MVVSAWVKDVGDADFEREVIEASRQRPVVVDFWAPWCGPCRMIGPVLERLAEEHGGAFVLAKVNVDGAQGVAAQYTVEAIPAVKAFRDGRPVLEFVGALPEAQIRAFLNRVLPSAADRLVEQAADLEAGKPEEAEAQYSRALEQDRDNEAALVGLARVLVARGRDKEAAELLANAAPGGELGAEAERLSAVLALREQGRAFADEAALRRRVEAEPGNAEVRYQLGCVLAAAGKYPEALQLLLSAAEQNHALAAAKVREAMVKVFHAVGVRSSLADEYRAKLAQLLY